MLGVAACFSCLSPALGEILIARNPAAQGKLCIQSGHPLAHRTKLLLVAASAILAVGITEGSKG
jgi:hypothetical protein